MDVLGAEAPENAPSFNELLRRFREKLEAIPADCHSAMGWLYAYRQLQDQRKRLLNRGNQIAEGKRVFWSGSLPAETLVAMAPLFTEAAQAVKRSEEQAGRSLAKALGGTEWYHEVAIPAARGQGISKTGGHVSAAKLLWAFGSASRFATFGKIIRYAGLAPEDGKAPKRRRGQKTSYSPQAWQALYDLSECWLRMPDCYWRQRWDALKAVAALNHPDWPTWKIHAWGRRRMLREFLRDLWEVWREWENSGLARPD